MHHAGTACQQAQTQNRGRRCHRYKQRHTRQDCDRSSLQVARPTISTVAPKRAQSRRGQAVSQPFASTLAVPSLCTQGQEREQSSDSSQARARALRTIRRPHGGIEARFHRARRPMSNVLGTLARKHERDPAKRSRSFRDNVLRFVTPERLDRFNADSRTRLHADARKHAGLSAECKRHPQDRCLHPARGGLEVAAMLPRAHRSSAPK